MKNSGIIIFMFTFASVIWLGGFVGVLALKKLGLLNGAVLVISHVMAIILPLILVSTLRMGYLSWNPLNAALHTASGGYVVVAIGFFVATMFFGLLYAILIQFGITALSAKAVGVLILTSTLLHAGYGFINANIIRQKEVELSVPADSALIGKRVTLVSDLHLGMTRQRRFAEKVSQAISASNPDLVIIAGDLIDGPKIPYKEVLEPLGTIQAPLGTYFVPGNHEQYNMEQADFYAAIPENIITLSDKVTVLDGVTLMGVDYTSETEEQLARRLDQWALDVIPDIAVIHDPKLREVLGKRGAQVVLSGHTHGGQLFPSTALVRMIYKEKSSGLFSQSGTHYFTTVGVGTGGIPARTGTKPEVVTLTFTAEE
jgi:hypothetical protein